MTGDRKEVMSRLEERELEKSYRGFVIWMVCFLGCCIGFPFLVIDNTALVIRMIMNMMNCSMAILTYMIYRNGYVYWYTGITYEDAAKVSEERRKEYAFKHLKIFGLFAVIFLAFSVLMHLLKVSYWMDFVVGTIGLIVVAVRTIWFKL